MKGPHPHLQTVIDAFSLLENTIPKLTVVVKDTESKHIYCSRYWAKKMGMSVEEICSSGACGRLRGDITPEIEQQIIAEDQYIITEKRPLTLLQIPDLAEGLTPLYCVKSPIIDPKDQRVVGIFAQGFRARNISFTEIMFDNTHSNPTAAIPALTTREKQVIFLFLSNLSSQDIAKKLGEFDQKSISKSTIDGVFNAQLYPKFGVYSRPELHKKLLTMGFSSRIPKELLAVRTLMLNGIEVY